MILLPVIVNFLIMVQEATGSTWKWLYEYVVLGFVKCQGILKFLACFAEVPNLKISIF